MNPIEKLEQELQEKQNDKHDISYHVRISRNQLNILAETAKEYNLKQSDVIRYCIEQLPEIIKNKK